MAANCPSTTWSPWRPATVPASRVRFRPRSRAISGSFQGHFSRSGTVVLHLKLVASRVRSLERRSHEYSDKGS
jgi:hypothetical protein